MTDLKKLNCVLDFLATKLTLMDNKNNVIDSVDIDGTTKISEFRDYWNTFTIDGKEYDINIWVDDENDTWHSALYKVFNDNTTDWSNPIAIKLTIQKEYHFSKK